LTSGSPRIVHSQALVGEQAHLLQLAGALQRGSEHPLAKAVLDACEEQGLPVAAISNSQSLTGRGIAGSLDGRELALGNRRLLDESG
ncbi:copper-transporting ATPase, partial [Pseudomonas frederiksbergensis]|nr:copper-transporting ATPase [Pseudomonas frederiksbergensis]